MGLAVIHWGFSGPEQNYRLISLLVGGFKWEKENCGHLEIIGDLKILFCCVITVY